MNLYYENDFCKVYNNNCLDVLSDVLCDYANVVFVSDPPFNVGYKYDKHKDKMPEDDYYNMLFNVFNMAPSVVIHYPEQLHKLSIALKQTPKRVVSWVYPSNTPKQHRDIAFYGVTPDFTKCGQPYKNPTDKRIKERIAQGKSAKLYDWWEINQIKNVTKKKLGFEHGCIMPLEVMERIIKILPDDVVIIDPFCGSGTTLLAAQRNGKKSIGIELSQEYCEIVKTRLINNQ